MDRKEKGIVERKNPMLRTAVRSALLSPTPAEEEGGEQIAKTQRGEKKKGGEMVEDNEK